MKKIILITQYYEDDDPMRQAEMELALTRNYANSHIHSIHLMMKQEDSFSRFEGYKIHPRYSLKKRAKFLDAFRLARRLERDDAIYVVANSDIYFDDTIQYLHNINYSDHMYVVTRKDLEKDGSIVPAKEYTIDGKKVKQHPAFSYDAWVFDNSIFETQFNKNFYMGVFNAECRLSEEATNAGVKMFNLHNHVNAVHVHWSDKRKTEIEGLVGLKGYEGGFFQMKDLP
jgi:hypothetical protein